MIRVYAHFDNGVSFEDNTHKISNMAQAVRFVESIQQYGYTDKRHYPDKIDWYPPSRISGVVVVDDSS